MKNSTLMVSRGFLGDFRRYRLTHVNLKTGKQLYSGFCVHGIDYSELKDQ